LYAGLFVKKNCPSGLKVSASSEIFFRHAKNQKMKTGDSGSLPFPGHDHRAFSISGKKYFFISGKVKQFLKIENFFTVF
jgi:hypothetical protein